MSTLNHYTKTHRTVNSGDQSLEWIQVTGPGLAKPRHYPTEQVADEAIALFEAIYKAGQLSRE